MLSRVAASILLALVSAQVIADVHDDEGDAYAHCLQVCNEHAGQPSETVDYRAIQCDIHGAGDAYKGTLEVFFTWNGASNGRRDCGDYPGGGPSTHQFLQSCEARENGSEFFTDLEPPAVCQNGCEVEPTTGTCTDGVGGEQYQCFFDMESTGNICDPEATPPDDDDLPTGCARGSDGSVSCDCSVTPEAQYCQNPPDENDDDPPENCAQLVGQNIWYCADWPPQGPAPDPGDPVPDGCYVSGTILYCPPGNDPDPPTPPNPSPPIDSGDPQSPQQPGDPGSDPGGPGGPGGPGDGDGNEPGCEGDECSPDNSSASTVGGCDNGPPQCEGNPINCAILRQGWRSICSALDTGANKAPWEDDPDWGRDLKTEATEIDVAGMVNDSGSGGSCPANPTAAVFGMTFEINLAYICDVAEILRFFVLLTAWMSAAFIVSRAL